jgi:hypothetical protein
LSFETAYIDRVAMHPMVTVPTMSYGRVAVLPVVAIVAASGKANSDSISAAVCYEIPNQATSATVGALRPRRARPASNSFTELKFSQAWLAES